MSRSLILKPPPPGPILQTPNKSSINPRIAPAIKLAKGTQVWLRERKFNLPIWYVLSNEDFDYKTWFWIPISKVLEEGKNPKFKSGKSNMDFFAISVKEFIQIAADDSLDRLFSKCFIEETK